LVVAAVEKEVDLRPRALALLVQIQHLVVLLPEGALQVDLEAAEALQQAETY
jgi:hypothetical protein